VKFRILQVQEVQAKNGHPIAITDLDVGYNEFLEFDKRLPGPRPSPENKNPCSLLVRATRPDGSTAELLANLLTSDDKLPHGLLSFYRCRSAEIPVGSEIELIGYEMSPI